MAGVLQVDMSALRRLSSDLVTAADGVAGDGGSAATLDEAAAALPGSQTAAACRAARPRIVGGLDGLAGRIRATADAVTGATDAFAESEAALERTLGRMAAVPW